MMSIVWAIIAQVHKMKKMSKRRTSAHPEIIIAVLCFIDVRLPNPQLLDLLIEAGAWC